MNVFNRLVMILLTLVVAVVTAVFIIVPRQVLDLVVTFFRWVSQEVDIYLKTEWAYFAAGRVIIGGAIVVLCLILLWLEVRRPRKKVIRVQKMAGGEAYITVDSIAQRLAYNVDQLPDVVKVSPKIIGKSRGVDIDLLLETSPEIDVPMKTEEVLQVTHEVVSERMGLKLGKVQVKIKHAPYPKA